MKTIEVTTKAFQLDLHEAKTVMVALDYVSHRQNTEGKGMHATPATVERLRKELRDAIASQ